MFVSAAPVEVWVSISGPVDETHFNTIQDGIDAVADGGTVHVASGTYVINATIDIAKNISLLGDGQDTTIIDGSGYFRIMSILGPDNTSLIDGFKIQYGFSLTTCAGIYIQLSSPTISNCTFTFNNSGYGGAIYNELSSPTISNCTFIDNDASIAGGAIYSIGSSPDIDECTFTSNFAYSWGGAICDATSSSQISNCLFQENGTYSLGGAICTNACISFITDCIFLGNWADYGGAIESEGSTDTITNCILAQNIATGSGGGIFSLLSQLTVSNCTIANNISQSVGGIYIVTYESPIDISFDGFPTDSDGPLGPSTITNCIVYGNIAINVFEEGLVPSVVSFSDIGGGYLGTGNIDQDPLFVNAAGGDFSIPYASPCVNTGTDTSDPLYGNVTDDIEDNPRPLGSGHDMGAYEYVSPISVTITSATANCDGTVDVTALAADGIPPYTYEWDIDGDGYDDGTGASATLNVGYDYTGTISVQVTDDDLYTATDDDSSAWTSPELTVSITSFNVDHSTGTMDATALASGGDDSYTYEWDIDGDGYDDGIGASVTLNPGFGATGTAMVRVTDGNSCTATDSEPYSVNDQITVSITSFTINHCDGTIDATASAAGGDGNYTYEWDIDGGGYDDGTGASVTLNPGFGTTGTVVVRVTDGNSCTATDSEPYAVNEQLTISLSVGYYDTGTATFTAAAAGGDGSYTYDWDLDGDGTYEVTGTTSLTQTIVRPSWGNSGTVNVLVTDGNSCTATDSADYVIGSLWSPAVLQPIVATMLEKANTIWHCLQQNLPEEVPENLQEMLDEVQEHMANASLLYNPIYANGELNKALALMKEINDALGCGC